MHLSQQAALSLGLLPLEKLPGTIQNVPGRLKETVPQLALVLGACWDTAEVCLALISSPTLKGQSGRELLSNYPV